MTRLPLLAALLASLSLAACAGDPDGPGGGPGDGRRAEGPGPRGPPRPRASVFLSPAGQPFRAGPGAPYPVADWFAQADKDHDGHMNLAEFKADFQQFFSILDTNHDSVIDSFELADYEHRVAPEILSFLERPGPQGADGEARQGGGRGDGGGRGGGRGRRGGGGGGQSGGGQRSNAAAGRLVIQGAAAYSLFNVSEPVSAADLDFDGKITLAEFLTLAERRFNTLDSKTLGYLALETLPRTPEQIQIEGKKPTPKP